MDARASGHLSTRLRRRGGDGACWRHEAGIGVRRPEVEDEMPICVCERLDKVGIEKKKEKRKK